jgi:prevent-host-death family protein
MKSVNVKTARSAFRKLLQDVGSGHDVLIVRRGKAVARLVPVSDAEPRHLPSLRELRSSIEIKGRAPSTDVIAVRRQERY